ncbi:MAG: DUF3343 domain-containing protein [Lachnospiraceae bacterium]|nr:DUF3343 domain-containing protein [Lachnospiraceae bacterium]
MARKKKNWLVVTFSTVTAAMAMEDYCMGHGVAGRIIPLPQEISAGCGLSWRTQPEEKENLIQMMAEAGLTWESMHECML